jgi:CMP-N-acetylneuraminic acid synthetase
MTGVGKEAWIVIPARQGQGKNTWLLNGRPMIEYCIAAAKQAKEKEKDITNIICTTNDPVIQRLAERHNIAVDLRPEEWSGPRVPIAQVIHEHLLPRWGNPEVIILVQPTSPFVRSIDIKRVAGAVLNFPIQSAMTSVSVPHNFHAWNQRMVVPGRMGDIDFVFRRERSGADMKQKKPPHLAFGNVVAVRSKALKSGTFFPTPCLSYKIDRVFALDVDMKEDIVWAEALLSAGAVSYLGDSE